MSRPVRGLLAQVFVVLAIVSLASIALAPRGVVRAVVAADLDLPVLVQASPAIDAATDGIHLPGVRAVVSREEQDPHEALLDALAGPAPAVARTVPPASGPLDDAGTAAPAPASASSNGDRAPPAPV